MDEQQLFRSPGFADRIVALVEAFELGESASIDDHLAFVFDLVSDGVPSAGGGC